MIHIKMSTGSWDKEPAGWIAFLSRVSIASDTDPDGDLVEIPSVEVFRDLLVISAV